METYMMISEMERARQWRERSAMVPALHFRPEWGVAVIPPFSGADARFIVTQGQARVSVYLDFDGRLGAMDQPYWEVYPLAGDVGRFLLGEAEELIAAIAESIAEQATPSRPSAPTAPRRTQSRSAMPSGTRKCAATFLETRMEINEAIAVFDKSAERTRPNAQTEAWAVIRQQLADATAKVGELERALAEARETLREIAGFKDDPGTPVRNSVKKSGIARRALTTAQDGEVGNA